MAVDHVTLTRAFKREAKRLLNTLDGLTFHERYFIKRVARGKLGRRDVVIVHAVGKGAYQASVEDPLSEMTMFADF